MKDSKLQPAPSSCAHKAPAWARVGSAPHPGDVWVCPACVAACGHAQPERQGSREPESLVPAGSQGQSWNSGSLLVTHRATLPTACRRLLARLCWGVQRPPSTQPPSRSRLRRDLGRPRPGSPRGSGVHSYLVPDPIAFAHQPGPLHRMPGLQRRGREVAAVGSGPLLGPGVPCDGRWGTGKKANPTLLGGAYVWVPSCSLGMKSRDPNLLPSNICGPVFSSIPLLWAGDAHPPVPEASALMPPPSPCS